MRASNLVVGAGAIASATLGPACVVGAHGTTGARYYYSADVRELDTLEILSDPAFRRDVEAGIREADRGDLVSFEDVFGEPL